MDAAADETVGAEEHATTIVSPCPSASAWRRARPASCTSAACAPRLFNWLFARHQGGEFRLRIENTDTSREVAEAVEQIQESLRWLGLDWDGAVTFQLDRMERRQEEARRLVAEGKAYEDEGAIRFRMPDEGDDGVGRRRARAASSSRTSSSRTSCIVRSDGRPTYNFASPVEDLLDGITHVIRGDDHVSNTPKQINILRALGAEMPVYAHVPNIYGDDGKKLSKRHGAVTRRGVPRRRLPARGAAELPRAARLELRRQDDDHDAATSSSSASRSSASAPSPATFDYEKLDWMNGVYLRALAAGRVRRRGWSRTCASRATTGTRSSSAGRAARAGEDRDARRVSRLRRLPLRATSSPIRRCSTARTCSRRPRALARGRAVHGRDDRAGAARPRRAARAEAAAGVPADPGRRHGLEGLARAVREPGAARRARRALERISAARRRSGLGGASGSSARWNSARRAAGTGASAAAASCGPRGRRSGRGGRRWDARSSHLISNGKRLSPARVDYGRLDSPGAMGLGASTVLVVDDDACDSACSAGSTSSSRATACSRRHARRGARGARRRARRRRPARRPPRRRATGASSSTSCAREHRDLRSRCSPAAADLDAEVASRADAVIAKPFELDELVATVRGSLASGRARVTIRATVSVAAVRSPAEFEARLQRYLFERSEEGRAVRVGEKEAPSRRRSSPATPISSAREQLDALREAEEEARRATSASGSTGCARRARAGSSPPSSPSARTSSRTRSSPRASTLQGEEMPLRTAQAKLAVLADVRRPRGARRRSRPSAARRSTTTASSCSARPRSSTAELSGEPDPVERNEEEKGISLRELERVLAAASDAVDGAVRAPARALVRAAARPRARRGPVVATTSRLHAPALAARVDVHEGARVEVCIDDAHRARLRPRERPNIRLDLDDRPQKSPRACVIASDPPTVVHLITRAQGGLHDYQAFLHEAGHALHYARLRPGAAVHVPAASRATTR